VEQQSVPLPKPQPQQPRYGIHELYLFREFTRENYEQTFGLQPPAFDPTRPVKAWFDSSAAERLPGEVVTYSVVRKVANEMAWQVAPFVITAEQAAHVNLPGAYRYPAYKPAATPATVGAQSLNPVYLTSYDEATNLAKEIGAQQVYEAPVPTIPGQDINWNGEARRPWHVRMVNGHAYAAGILIAQKCARGVGAPGFWRLSQQGDPVWQPLEQIASVPNANVMPVPVRDLLPNERFGADSFSASPAVIRTDLELPGSGPVGDAAWKAAVLDALGRIEQKLIGVG
jgi:hypothetical protein